MNEQREEINIDVEEREENIDVEEREKVIHAAPVRCSAYLRYVVRPPFPPPPPLR